MKRSLMSTVFLIVVCFPLFAQAQCKTNIPFHKANRFIDNHDGTVVDTLTGLMWMRCPLGQNWDETKHECEIPYDIGSVRLDVKDTWNRVLVETQTLNATTGYAQHFDWRIPNIKELASISMLHCYPPIDTSVFTDAGSSVGATEFWSSTPSRKLSENIDDSNPDNPQVTYHTQAWTFSIAGGLTASKVIQEPTDNKHWVMLVRGE